MFGLLGCFVNGADIAHIELWIPCYRLAHSDLLRGCVYIRNRKVRVRVIKKFGPQVCSEAQ